MVLEAELRFNSKSQEKRKQRNLLLTGPGAGIHGMPCEATQGCQGSVQTAEGSRTHGFIRAHGWSAVVSQVKAGLVNPNPKEQFWYLLRCKKNIRGRLAYSGGDW